MSPNGPTKKQFKAAVSLANNFIKTTAELVKEEYEFLRGLSRIKTKLSLDSVRFNKDGSFELKGLKAKTAYKK